MELFPLFEKLNKYYKEINTNYDFNQNNLNDIEDIINTVIDGYEPLLIFHLEERVPFDIKTAYEVFELRKEKRDLSNT